MASDPTDLIHRAQQGDQAAFEALYRQHVGRVYALCLRLTSDPAQAEELTQDAFVRAWQRLASFRGESALGSWLYRLTVNVVFLHLRGARRRSLRVLTTDDPSALERPAGGEGESGGPAGAPDLGGAVGGRPPGERPEVVLDEGEGYRHEGAPPLT